MNISDVSLCVQPWGIAPPSPRELAEVARHAEGLGFYALTLAYRPILPTADEPPAGGYVFRQVSDQYRHYQYDPLVLAPMLVQATSRLRVGFNVLVTPMLHPFVWAKYLSSLDAASDGRVIAGLGSGYAPADNIVPALDRIGIDSRQRGGMSDEALDMMTQLWTSERPITFSGRFYTGRDLVVAPKSCRKPYPEIWWGGQGGPSFSRAARYARFLEVVRPSIRSIRERYGPRLAEENARYSGHATIAVLLNAAVLLTTPPEAELSQRYFDWPPHVVNRLPVGTPERCADVLRAYEAAGATHFVLDFHRHGLDHVSVLHEHMDRLASHVVPLL